jgi:hypothetical protein
MCKKKYHRKKCQSHLFYLLISVLIISEEIARQLTSVGASVIFGVTPMAEMLQKMAQMCPSVRQVILLGPPQEGFVCFQQMLQDSGDLFNDNVDVSLTIFTVEDRKSLFGTLNLTSYSDEHFFRSTFKRIRSYFHIPVVPLVCSTEKTALSHLLQLFLTD